MVTEVHGTTPSHAVSRRLTPFFTPHFTFFFTLLFTCKRRERQVKRRDSLLSLQRHALRSLRTLLFQNGAGHPPLAVDLELEERPSRILKADL